MVSTPRAVVELGLEGGYAAARAQRDGAQRAAQPAPCSRSGASAIAHAVPAGVRLAQVARLLVEELLAQRLMVRRSRLFVIATLRPGGADAAGLRRACVTGSGSPDRHRLVAAADGDPG